MDINKILNKVKTFRDDEDKIAAYLVLEKSLVTENIRNIQKFARKHLENIISEYIKLTTREKFMLDIKINDGKRYKVSNSKDLDVAKKLTLNNVNNDILKIKLALHSKNQQVIIELAKENEKRIIDKQVSNNGKYEGVPPMKAVGYIKDRNGIKRKYNSKVEAAKIAQVELSRSTLANFTGIKFDKMIARCIEKQPILDGVLYASLTQIYIYNEFWDVKSYSAFWADVKKKGVERAYRDIKRDMEELKSNKNKVSEDKESESKRKELIKKTRLEAKYMDTRHEPIIVDTSAVGFKDYEKPEKKIKIDKAPDKFKNIEMELLEAKNAMTVESTPNEDFEITEWDIDEDEDSVEKIYEDIEKITKESKDTKDVVDESKQDNKVVIDAHGKIVGKEEKLKEVVNSNNEDTDDYKHIKLEVNGEMLIDAKIKSGLMKALADKIGIGEFVV